MFFLIIYGKLMVIRVKVFSEAFVSSVFQSFFGAYVYKDLANRSC